MEDHSLESSLATGHEPTMPTVSASGIDDAAEADVSAPSSPVAAAATAAEDEADEGGFSPVLSKSARRRQARRQNALVRSEARPAGHRAVPLPLSFSFHTPADAGHLQVHHSSSPYRAAVPAAPVSPPALRALREMFPALGADVLGVLLETEGSFDRVVEYVLSTDSAATREERQLQQALDASRDIASPGVSPSCSPSVAVDHLSALPTELFHAVTGLLDVFSLAALSAVNKESQRQVEVTVAEVESLDLSKARFSHWGDSRILGMVSRHHGLQQLSLRNTAFRTFHLLAGACFGRHLRALSLSGCVHLEDHHLIELLGLECLTSLDLGGTDITDDGCDHIATARWNAQLERIDLSHCRFVSTFGMLRLIERCVSLRNLDLRGTNVARGLLAFPTRSALRELNLSKCRKIPAEMAITSRFCSLTTLSLCSNPQLASVTLAVPSLLHLNLSNSQHVASLALHAPALQTLNLNGCLLLRSIGGVPSHGGEFASRLHSLNANGCRSITGHSFHQLLASASDTLTALACRGCLLLNDANLHLLLRSEDGDGGGPAGSHLESLDLSGCKAASLDAVRTLQRQVAATLAARQLADQQRAQLDVPVDACFASSLDAASGAPNLWAGGLDDDSSDLPDSSPVSQEESQPLHDA